jgi:hypothetical protein
MKSRLWVELHTGKLVKRPRGRMVYRIIAIQPHPAFVLLERPDGTITKCTCKQVSKMRVVPED